MEFLESYDDADVQSVSEKCVKSTWINTINIENCYGANANFYSVLNFEGTKVATAGYQSKEIKLWDTSNGALIASYTMSTSKFMISGFISGDRIVVVTKNYIGILNAPFNSLEKVIKVTMWSSLFTSIDFHTMCSFYATPFGSRAFSCHSSGNIHIWDLNKRKLLKKIEDYGLSYAADMDNKGNYLLCGTCDGSVKLWRIKGKLINRIFYGHRDSVLAVKLKVNLKRIVSGSADKSIIIWDIRTTNVLFRLSNHVECIVAVCWSSDDSIILSASSDKTTKVWNSSTGELIQTLEGHSELVKCIGVSCDGNKIVTTSADKSIKIWT